MGELNETGKEEMSQPHTLEGLPAAKWRFQFCKAAYRELRAFMVRGEVEMGLKCHRCGKTGIVKKEGRDGQS